jgi:tetratricopeptide (TPR) repeat protein
VPSDEKRDEGEEQRPDETSATEPEGAEAEEFEAGAEAPAEAGEPSELEAEAPRNRAERRAAAKRERRGVRPNRSVVEPGVPLSARPRVPPKTVTGRSSADEVPPWARKLVDTMGRHRGTLIGGAVVVVAVVAGSIGWTLRREHKQAEAAALFQQAVEIEMAPIRAADAPPEPASAPPRRGPTYPDHVARSRAALEAFRRVSQRFPDAPITPLARLSEATALYDLGRYAEARRVYESLLGADVGGQEGRVYEGLGFALEAQNDLPGALRRYEELGRIQDGAWRDLAAFHQARVLHRQGQDNRAKDILHGLLERLSRSRPDDVLGAGGSGSVYEQAQSLLRDIDPTDPQARRPATDPSELLRMLERQTGQRIRMERPAGTPGTAGAADGGP